MKKIIMVLFLMIFSFACKRIGHNNFTCNNCVRIERKYHINGRIASVKCFLQPDNNEYIYIKYDNKGILLDSFKVMNDKIVGYRKFLDDNEEINLIQYKTGQVYGEVKLFNKEGTLLVKGFKIDDIKVGPWVFYYSHGVLEKYYSYDKEGHLRYSRIYEEDSIGYSGDADPPFR